MQSKHKHGTSREQFQMLSMDMLIASDNPVRIIDAFVDTLDLKQMGFRNMTPPADGQPPYHPGDLLKLYIYGYGTSISTSRKLERECTRNIEVHWLIGGLAPAYHTIADFRKDNRKALKGVFRAYNMFLKDQGLFEDDTIAVDGSKFRAQNSKKNNYNQKKIDRHLNYIDNKIEGYLRQLEKSDKDELEDDEPKINRSKVEQEIKKLKERKAGYLELEKQVQESADGQVSTSDPESRALIINKNIVEVSYNTQTSFSQTHKLICDTEVTNKNDAKALHKTAKKAKDFLGKEKITALADKGYHNGEQLTKCSGDGIETLVAYRRHTKKKEVPTPDYYVEKFTYNRKSDTYTCPQGNTLRTTGTWHTKSKGKGRSSPFTYKKYRTSVCKNCLVKHLCTTRKDGRDIERSQYQDHVDENNKRVDSNKELYRTRQEICEHPFGTIKRSWGYTYTLLKGIEKVQAEMDMIALCYNIRRSMSILGVSRIVKELTDRKLAFLPHFWQQIRLILGLFSAVKIFNPGNFHYDLSKKTPPTVA